MINFHYKVLDINIYYNLATDGIVNIKHSFSSKKEILEKLSNQYLNKTPEVKINLAYRLKHVVLGISLCVPIINIIVYVMLRCFKNSKSDQNVRHLTLHSRLTYFPKNVPIKVLERLPVKVSESLPVVPQDLPVVSKGLQEAPESLQVVPEGRPDIVPTQIQEEKNTPQIAQSVPVKITLNENKNSSPNVNPKNCFEMLGTPVTKEIFSYLSFESYANLALTCKVFKKHFEDTFRSKIIQGLDRGNFRRDAATISGWYNFLFNPKFELIYITGSSSYYMHHYEYRNVQNSFKMYFYGGSAPIYCNDLITKIISRILKNMFANAKKISERDGVDINKVINDVKKYPSILLCGKLIDDTNDKL